MSDQSDRPGQSAIGFRLLGKPTGQFCRSSWQRSLPKGAGKAAEGLFEHATEPQIRSGVLDQTKAGLTGMEGMKGI
jgi:hypothetical protein